MSEPILELRDIHKSYGDTRAVNGVTVQLAAGEVFSLLGPSGCGKTTLLRVVSGFERPDAGQVWLNGRDITELPPNKRQINTVFQNYALFPHLTVEENIEFGRKVAKVAKEVRTREVQELLKLMELQEHVRKRPSQLSGGQKQRVAIARALINHPRVLLLDEPLGALDLKLRQRMLLELDRIQQEVGITFLYVTHDQAEAMSLSDRIAVMNHGKIEQIGTPEEIYEHPRTRFVASFIGDTHLFEGQVRGQSGEYIEVEVADLGKILVKRRVEISNAGRVAVSVRPEKMRIEREPVRAEGGKLFNQFAGVIEGHIYLGSQSHYYVRLGRERIQVSMPHSTDWLQDAVPVPGDKVWLSWYADSGWLIGESEGGHE